MASARASATTAVAGSAGTGDVHLQYNPYQQAFWDALDRRASDMRRAFSRLALFAGRQGGKTLAGALGCAKAARVPGQVIWACAPSYPKLHDYVMPALAAMIPPAWLAKPFSAQHYEWQLTNGTLIQARSLDDVQRGRGPTLDLLWIDEAREVAPVAFKTLVPTLAVKKGAVIITTTPNGFDYWYETFWAPAAEGIPGYWACKYRSLDNPAMDPEEVERSRREMDPLFFQQEWEAEFVSFSGAIYGPSLSAQILEKDEDVRRVLPEWPKIDPGRACLVGLDPGSDHPFAAVQIVATEYGLIVVGEYEARNESTMGHARALRQLLARDNPARPFDPVTWAIDKSQKQFSIELMQHGVLATAAPNEVMAGIQRVKSWILGQRLWFVKARCPRLIASLFSYRYAENTDARGAARSEKVVKINDDLPDCFVAGTGVTTARGSVPIEQVSVGDHVWTRAGWKPVTDQYALPEPHSTLVLKTRDGHVLQGTETHRIWVEGKGWTCLSNVRLGDMLWTCTPTTITVVPASSGDVTTVRSHEDTTSITATETKQTTRSTIYAVSQRPPTYRTTDGTDILSPSRVPIVSESCPDGLATPASVPMPAKRAGDVNKEPTSNRGSARRADDGLPSVASLTRDTVPDRAVGPARTSDLVSRRSVPNVAAPSLGPTAPCAARTVVTSVTTGAPSVVYNLTVAEVHEYFAESILVKNSLRYALMTWPELPFPEAPSELRDLSRLPDAARWALDREQRMTHPDLFEDETLDTPGMLGSSTVETGSGDFWG